MPVKAKPLVVLVEDEEDDLRLCRPQPGDVRKDPMRCVVAHYLHDTYPWAKHITVGTQTIRMFDYRCKHNPTGKLGGCDQCVGRRLDWATPLVAAKAIREYDAGNDPVFPPFQLRMSEAIEVLLPQDKQRKRAAMVKYNADVKSGARVPNKTSAKAKARSISNRRNG